LRGRAAPEARSSMLDIMSDKLADLRNLPGPGAVAA
jgi:hypothetical protein